jgi:prepilin-type N-terminal cleavage/methylation domain-containing protein
MRKAFTLIELLVVIFILAILTAIIVPTIRAIKKQSAAQTHPQPQRFTVTRTLINGGYGSSFVITLRDASTGKEYIGIPDVTLVEVPRSATGGVLCEAPITKESK